MAYRSLCETCKNKDNRCVPCSDGTCSAYEYKESNMRIGQFLEYKGFVGSIEFDATNKTYYGHLLDIGDLVCYQADNIIDLHEQYHLAANDYIEFKKEIDNELRELRRM